MIELLKIKDFATVITGGTPSTTKDEYWNGGTIPWLNSGELNQDLITSTRNYITEKGLKNSSTRLMPADSVLIALTGSTTGVVGYLTFEACANQSVSGVLPSDKHFPKYLYYYLKSRRKKIVSDAYGGAQPHISQGYIKELQIPLPPLEQQKKIAAILDAADAYRQKTKTLIAKYDELTQSLFLDMFGDSATNPKQLPIKFLEEICEEIIDCPHSTPNYVNYISEFPCIRTTELDNGTINWSKMKYLDYQGYIERTKRLTPQEGDIIYGREGSFGEAAIVPSDCKMSLGQRVMLFRSNLDYVNSKYLHAVVRSNGVYQQALKVTSGSTVGHINVKDIKKFKIIIAPIILQNQFAERVQAIEVQKAQAQASLEKSEDLFNSLLQRAFKGELV